MLVRVIAKNFLSFGDPVEFNLLPSSRQVKHRHHIYELDDFNYLKLSAIYGANGAGKSNLSKVLSTIQRFIKTGKVDESFYGNKNKFVSETETQAFAIEIIHENTPFLYGLEILDKEIISEELYISSLGKGANKTILKRRKEGKNYKLFLHEEFYENEEKRALLTTLEKNLLKKNISALKTILDLENENFEEISLFVNYFERYLSIILPHSEAVGLPLRLESESEFKEYVIQMMKSFGIGISDVETKTISMLEIAAFIDNDNLNKVKRIIQDFKENDSENIVMQMRGPDARKILFVKEQDEIVIKKLYFKHDGKGKQPKIFSLNEESDGTLRLLDYMPLFYDIIQNKKVYFVDEIERSIHPLLIKQLLEKFAKDKSTQGQLIFTTHETNLLDQDILRTDEIWFIEKDLKGSSKMYPLSDFKEHHSKNIQKGYLNGRYGAIPFLGNLQDLNWNAYAVAE